MAEQRYDLWERPYWFQDDTPLDVGEPRVAVKGVTIAAALRTMLLFRSAEHALYPSDPRFLVCDYWLVPA